MPNQQRRPDAANGKPRFWHPLASRDGEAVVVRELADAVRHPGRRTAAPTRAEMQMRLAETRSLIKAAERGDLQDQAWDDVRRHPLLWEIRLRWPGNILVRGYFHEPDLRSDRTVLAKVHVKVIVRGDLQATRARQNLAIEEAGRRIDFGRAWWWGLDATDPLWGQPSA